MAHDPVPTLLATAADQLGARFSSLPEVESTTPEQGAAMAAVLEETARRLGLDRRTVKSKVTAAGNPSDETRMKNESRSPNDE